MALNQSLNPDGVIACATVAANAKDFETAERLLQSIRSNYPEPAALSYRVALMQFRANRINDSQKTLLASIENGQHSSQIYDLLGHCYASQNKLQSAIASFEKAIDQEPSEESHYLDALQLLAENQLWRVLIRIAERGVAQIPNSDRLFRMKGLAETAMLYSEDALQSYRRALKINPDSAKANLGLGVAQRTMGRRKDAAATFQKGIEKFPNDGGHYQEYGLMLLKAGDSGDDDAMNRGVLLLQKAVDLDSSLYESHYQLGRVALEKDQVLKALPHLETAAKLAPGSSKVHYLLARAFRRLGRGEEARAHLQTFRRMKAAEESKRASAGGAEPPQTMDDSLRKDPETIGTGARLEQAAGWPGLRLPAVGAPAGSPGAGRDLSEAQGRRGSRRSASSVSRNFGRLWTTVHRAQLHYLIGTILLCLHRWGPSDPHGDREWPSLADPGEGHVDNGWSGDRFLIEASCGGLAFSDYDNDGFQVLYVTGLPSSALFHNEGDGTLSEVTERAGVRNAVEWAAGAVWFDCDRDWQLDLFVCNDGDRRMARRPALGPTELEP